MRPLISLCHATARLPEGWRAAALDWFAKADDQRNIEHVIVTDEWVSIDPVFPITRTGINQKDRCAVNAWNRAAELSSGHLLITLSDDWFPPEHWDTKLLSALPDLNGEYVLMVDNQDNAGTLLAFSLLTRKYYERYGYIFYPEYYGMMADREFSDVAFRDKVVVDARHLKFVHLNPENGTVEWDPTYRWQRREEVLKFGQDLYERRKKAGFPELKKAVA